MNSDGWERWVGLEFWNGQYVKCFAGTLDSEPDFDEGLDITQWDTADAIRLDLQCMSISNGYINILFSTLLVLNFIF